MTAVAKQHHIDVPHGDGTVQLGYLEWGDSGAARTALCIHGISRNAHDFNWLGRELAKAGWRVIAIDMVGRGASQWLDDPAGYAVPSYIQHIAHVATTLELGEVDWIGTSMGGMIGMVAASVGAISMRRLVLNDIGPFIASDVIAGIIERTGEAPVFKDEDAIKGFLMERFTPFGPVTDQQWSYFAHHSGRRDEHGDLRLACDPDVVVPLVSQATGDADLWEVYDAIKVPTLVVRGGESEVLDQATAEAMMTRGPRATLVTFHGITHPLWLTDDEQMHLVRDWLEGHPLSEDRLAAES
ncbi:MAG: alpha/beta hydrolase [Pseudomonadota bacterium]